MKLDWIETGDARELAKSLDDNSIDLIFTDPPYLKEFVPLYGWLAQEAARVLKPGGFCLTYIGKLYMDVIMQDMGKYLNWYWPFLSLEPGNSGLFHMRKIKPQYKIVLAFTKGEGKTRTYVDDTYTSSGPSKSYHKWGQNERTAIYFVEKFSEPEQVIYEPFAGGGTIPYACLTTGRHFYASEIDEKQAEIARKRLQHVQRKLIKSHDLEQKTLVF